MDDLISRQAAIDAVSRGCQAFGIFAECEKNLNALPSAERHGRWVDGEYTAGVLKMYGHKCSVCGAITPVSVARYRYCPNCGARMDEVGE